MKYWITKTNSGYGVIGGIPRPKRSLAPAPNGAEPGDGPHISFDGKRYHLDSVAKQARLAAEEKARQTELDRKEQVEQDRDDAIARLKQNPTPQISDILKVLRL